MRASGGVVLLFGVLAAVSIGMVHAGDRQIRFWRGRACTYRRLARFYSHRRIVVMLETVEHVDDGRVRAVSTTVASWLASDIRWLEKLSGDGAGVVVPIDELAGTRLRIRLVDPAPVGKGAASVG